MAWQDTLQDAVIDGFVFDCISTDETFSRAHSVHAYPYADGAEIEDLGQDALPISIQAILFGDDYETRLQQFITILKKPGLREFTHPVYGTMQVQVVQYQVHHDADNVDQCSISLSLLQNSIAPNFFTKTLAVQKAAAVQQQATSAREQAAQVMNDKVAEVVAGEDFNRIAQLRTSMSSALSQIKTQIQAVITTALDPITEVTGWCTDMTSLITGLVDLRSFDIDTLAADFKAVASAMDVAVLLPTQARQPEQDKDMVSSYVALQRVTGKVDAASLVLASETATPTMSATEIEAMTNEVRADIQTVIDQYRALYVIEEHRPVTEALKDSALAVQEAARAVIEARPPLVKKQMIAPGNYRLAAHRMYADHARAAELFRLNPTIKAPNFIDTGDVLNAYAQ